MDAFFGQYLDELARGKRGLDDPAGELCHIAGGLAGGRIACGGGGTARGVVASTGLLQGSAPGAAPACAADPQPRRLPNLPTAGLAAHHKAAKLAPGQTAGMLPPQAGAAGGMQPPLLHPDMAAQARLGVNGLPGAGAGLPMAVPGALPSDGLGMLPGGFAAQQQPLAAGGTPYVGAVNGVGGLPASLSGSLPGGLPTGLSGGLQGGLQGGLPAGLAGLPGAALPAGLPGLAGLPDLSAAATASDADGGGSGRGGRCKTLKQQEANKQAQQRVRARLPPARRRRAAMCAVD